MYRLMGILAKNELDFVVAIWWVKWHARNKLIFEGKKPGPIFSTVKAKAVMDAYKKVMVKEQKCTRSKEARKLQEWSPSLINCLKVNVDDTVHKDQQAAGLGAIIRNSLGQVIAAQSVKWGMEVAKEASLMDLIIETICSEAADLAN